METTVLRIEGMNCDHCKKAVTDALQELTGVKSVEVELNDGTATVAYDPAQSAEETLKEAVKAAGYAVA